MNRVVCVFFCFAAFELWTVSAQETGSTLKEERAPAGERSDASPIDVTQISSMLGVIAGELELIRREMGRPLADAPGLAISGAELRNVYFHARSLFEKSNRLAFEHTYTQESSPDVPSTEITTEDVQALLLQIHGQLKRVKAAMFIREEPLIEAAAETPDDASSLLIQIIQLNKQLNRMLEQRFAPQDVYKKVTESVHTMARILDRFPETRNIPKEPAFIRGKTPKDVFLRLHDTRQQLVSICESSKLNIPHLTLNSRDAQRIPSDVYDLAVLLETDLGYIHEALGDLDEPIRVLEPGRKFPSHVYQRVGILEAQIALLAEMSAADKTWTKHE